MQLVCVFFHICRKFEFLIYQGSVETCLRWDGYCHMDFVPNLICFPAVQKFWKSVKIWHSKRDLSFRDRDETETFGFWSETRPRPRLSCNSTRPRRDRRLIFATRRDRDWDLARPRPRRFSRPSTFSIVPKQWMANLPLLMSQTAQSLQLQLQCSLSWNLFTT